jgi:hypothetical protein
MTHQRHPNDPPPWRHLGAGPRSFRLGRRVVYRVGDLRARIDAQANASDAGAAASEQG